MIRSLIFPLALGLLGAAILAGLGIWQVQRLHWKQGVIAEIESRIHDAPVALPETPDPDRHRYLPVTLEGAFTGERLLVQASAPGAGAGYRVIGVYATDGGRRILVDRGFVAQDRLGEVAEGGSATVTGNLLWPDESDIFTPAPDRARGLWFARDVPQMAAATQAEPVLVTARVSDPPAEAPLRPVPVGTAGIPDNHLEYAITWFSLALVWLGMTAYWLWRITQRRG